MRTAIKLILLNLLIAQIIAPILVMIPCVIYLVATTGNLDKDALITMLMIPAQLAGQLMMGIYLWKAGYISTKKITWSPVSSPYLFFSALAVLTCGFVVSALAELMKWIQFLPHPCEAVRLVRRYYRILVRGVSASRK